MKKRYTIEEICKDGVDIENDGTVQQLRELLTQVFPKDASNITGGQKFYGRSIFDSNLWHASDATTRPTQSVKDFFASEWKPVRGEMVLVKGKYPGGWHERIYLGKIKGSHLPYAVVQSAEEAKYHAGEKVNPTYWKQVKQLKPASDEVELTINGKIIDPSELSEEQWNSLTFLGDTHRWGNAGNGKDENNLTEN